MAKLFHNDYDFGWRPIENPCKHLKGHIAIVLPDSSEKLTIDTPEGLIKRENLK